ncbi:MAG: hypothetical protein AABY22_36575 [Nanoarchaeota archaeon]
MPQNRLKKIRAISKEIDQLSKEHNRLTIKLNELYAKYDEIAYYYKENVGYGALISDNGKWNVYFYNENRDEVLNLTYSEMVKILNASK